MRKILAAREEVIYSHSWVNDTISGVMMASIDSNNRQFSITPKFSELFPGWEVPKSEAADAPVPAGSAEEVSAPNKTAGNLLNGAKATVKNAETILRTRGFIKITPALGTSVPYGFA